ncbi:aldose epimerase family protein [Streptomyces mutabilis]|uniref:aldose epimerase family protein n=1 Tax=Streptomyces mutabilis TaxID=67332 RepID=UPI001786DFF2|nr:aldose 1-epimerase family protein [Streptomyces mutabilis]GGQ35812.1 aldose 1-epimerase [Streptomyces mutabilis]
MNRTRITTERLCAEIGDVGAQLCSLRGRAADGTEREVLWDAGEPWAWHAPLLFPVIGRLPCDTLTHDGAGLAMPKHGFARDQRFRTLRAGVDGVVLELTDTPSTRRHFPFPFRVTADFGIEEDRLRIRHTVENPGPRPLSCSLGLHPGFCRPLPGAASRAGHRIVFAEPETAPVRRVDADLLTPESMPTPVRGRELLIGDELFTDGALVFDVLRSRALTYTAPGTPELRLAWEGFEQLAVWAPLGAELLCIEPWYGLPAPADAPSPTAEGLGPLRLEPGEHRTFTMDITVPG